MFENATTRRPRTTLLALIMLVILVWAIAVAWWVSRGPAQATDAGGQMVQSLRDKGLKSVWGDKPAETLYVIKLDGKVVAGAVYRREPLPGGGFLGMEMQISADRAAYEVWALSSDAGAGVYAAGRTDAGILKQDTGIVLKNGLVEARQTIRQGQQSATVDSSSPVPPNYLPEGTLRAGLHMVAQQRTDATFKLILNETPPQRVGDEIVTRFWTIKATHDGEQTVKIQGKDVKVSVVTQEMMESESVLWLTAQGEVVYKKEGQTETFAASQQELSKAFPAARTLAGQVWRTKAVPAARELLTQDQPPATLTRPTTTTAPTPGR